MADSTTYLDDFTEGMTAEFGRYAVSEEEILEFGRKYDPQPYHVDKEAAKSSIFGGLCASGWHICAMAMRMMVDHMYETGSASLGSPGVDEVRWRTPVYPGDRLSMAMTVKQVRPSKSRPEIGIVTSAYTVKNQKDQVVMTFIGNGFFSTRPGS